MKWTVLCVGLCALVGCTDLDDSQPQPVPADEGLQEAGAAAENIDIPPELQDHSASYRHKNCGHEVWCAAPNDGHPLYCSYPMAQTGCTYLDISHDAESDCQYACGHTACLVRHNYECASGCNGQC